jgi:NAD(P)H-dependent FMN reductase
MKVQVIIGSTRPGRVGPQIAQWIVKHLPQQPQVTYEIVDLADHTLPFFNEPIHPSKNQYSYEHTHKWSKKINEADATYF